VLKEVKKIREVKNFNGISSISGQQFSCCVSWQIEDSSRILGRLLSMMGIFDGWVF